MLRLLTTTLLVYSFAVHALAGDVKRVHFTVDLNAESRPISPYIYGVNAHLGKISSGTLVRLGGNRWTAYNWENNASNAGADWHHQNDGYLCESDAPGQAVRPAVEAAGRADQALIVTIPMAGYVSADKKPEGDVNQTPDYLSTRFHVSKPKKDGPLSLKPDTSDAVVYQDEFVHWIERSARVTPTQPIFYSLDNEPDLWSHTHPRIHPDKVTYAEVVERTRDYAAAIKDVKPEAMVFGPASYGWNGYRTLQDAPDGNGRFFLEYYLQEMKKAEATGGRRLLDVLDVHWYPEARGGDGEGVRIIEKDASPAVAAARVQAPRSLWDPTYTERSWITERSLHEPIALLPRLQKMIDQNYPGTKLAITEYNYGGCDDISGAIAQADALGIFGRYGVFAAAWWDLDQGSRYTKAAFDMYLNYDGKGSRFGDRSMPATTDDIESSAIYASTSSTDPAIVTLVLINRSAQPIDAQIEMKSSMKFNAVDAYQLTGDAPTIHSLGRSKLAQPNTLSRTLLPMSVVTMRLHRSE